MSFLYLFTTEATDTRVLSDKVANMEWDNSVPEDPDCRVETRVTYRGRKRAGGQHGARSRSNARIFLTKRRRGLTMGRLTTRRGQFSTEFLENIDLG